MPLVTGIQEGEPDASIKNIQRYEVNVPVERTIRLISDV